MYAVVKHRPDESTWIVEVLPTAVEAGEWAQVFAERGEVGVTYTVEEVTR